MKKKSGKTTSTHFKIFRKEAELWIDRLGLSDWRVDFRHAPTPDGKPARAWFGAQVEDRVATIALTPKWEPGEITEGRLRASAFHEVMELLLCPLCWVAECRFAQAEEIPEAVHYAIRPFENLFYGPGKKKMRKAV